MKHKKLALGAAAGALLGSAAPAGAADASWEIDSATMYYSESGRVSLVEPVVSARRKWDDRAFGVKLTLDTLTGPSPNGATPASTPQTFTGPSGGGGYTANAGDIPLDETFKDTRVAVAVDYTAPLAGAWNATYGLNGSKEYDYLSIGGSLLLSRDFNQHNTTLSVGGSMSQDSIEPVGGAPVPLSVMQARQGGGDGGEDEGEGEDDDKPGGSAKHKTVADALVGITQVLGPRSLMRVNLTFSSISGYQTDPYKLLSVVGRDGEPLRYVYESRPDSRTKTGVYTEYLHAFGSDTFKTAYRFQTDNWGIKSQTVELSYRWRMTEATYLEPQLRWYTQTAADFYHVALFDGQETTVQDATADYRLGGMDTWTAGLQLGHRLASGSELSLRVAYYQQTPDEGGVPPEAAAGLAKFDKLVPDTKAVMATIGFRFSL